MPTYHVTLSAREIEVLALVAMGQGNKQIAEALHLSVNTVKINLSSAMTKLRAENRTRAVVRAMQLGFLPLDPVVCDKVYPSGCIAGLPA